MCILNILVVGLVSFLTAELAALVLLVVIYLFLLSIFLDVVCSLVCCLLGLVGTFFVFLWDVMFLPAWHFGLLFGGFVDLRCLVFVPRMTS